MFCSQATFAVVRDWDHAELGDPAQIQKAIENLKKQNGDSLNLLSFAQGVSLFHQNKFEESLTPLQDSVKGNFILDDYAHYFLGLSYEKLEKWDEAVKAFEKVAQDKNSGPRKLSAIYRLGEIALIQKKYSLAERHFGYLERRVRGSDKYPFVIWHLAKLNAKSNKTYKACTYVRRLYSKYPAHELTANWSLNLRAVVLDDVKPNCLDTLNEQKTRIRNLQYAGESERARREIQDLYKNTNEINRYHVDMIYGRFLIDDGEVEEAFKVLMPYYSQKAGDIAYLMQIGKGAARKGDAALAINSYLKVHNMKPRSSVGREALFQAAYVSYLNQDYDGALIRFSNYKRMYGGQNGMAASWLIAWVRYLKGDYKGAYDDFNRFSKMRFSKRLRNLYFDPTKINYWKGVTLVKMGQVNQGVQILQKLASDPSRGFYALSAQARLLWAKSLNPNRQIAGLEEKNSRLVGAESLTPLSLISPRLPVETQSANPVENFVVTEAEILADIRKEGGSAEEEGAEGEDVEPIAEGESDTDSDSDVALEQASPEVEAEDPSLPSDIVATFKDPRLSVRFQRAETLRGLGFEEWSNRELQYIEARTRNKSYLEALVDRYEQGSEYNRSAYIAEIYYGAERNKGFTNNFGWRKAFPLAFNKQVKTASSDFGIPAEFIYGIMRTESFFKPKVKSSVGALGLMQVMPLTATRMAESIGMKDFNVSKLTDPHTNIQVGVKYIQRLGKMFNKEWPLVAAGYNAGPHRVYAWLKHFGNLSADEFIEHIPYSQTRGYVKKVIRTYYVYGAIDGSFTANDFMWLASPVKASFNGEIPTKETWETL